MKEKLLDNRFEKIYNLYSAKAAGLAYSILHNYHDAEEAVQNAFLAISRNIDKLTNPESHMAEAYVLRAVKNHAINIYRQRKLRSAEISLDELESTASEIDIAETAVSNDSKRELLEFICHMKPIYRDALIYFYLYDMSIQQIADLTSCTINTASCRLKRGRNLVRQFFKGGKINE